MAGAGVHLAGTTVGEMVGTPGAVAGVTATVDLTLVGAGVELAGTTAGAGIMDLIVVGAGTELIIEVLIKDTGQAEVLTLDMDQEVLGTPEVIILAV